MKLINDIQNWILRIKYNLRIGKTTVPKGKLIWEENFSHLKHWHVVTEGNWGAVYPDSLTCSTPKNVELVEEGVRLYTRREPGGIVGKDFEGNKQRKYFSSAELYTSQTIWGRRVYEIHVNFDNSGKGSWDAVWLFGEPEDGNAQEIDLFENCKHCEITTHDRGRQYKFLYPKLKGRHIITGVVDTKKTAVYIDGYKVFETRKNWFKNSLARLRISTGLKHRADDLPYYFTVERIKIYRNEDQG